jgi:hypothetical protein
MISMPMVHSVQIMHLSCTEINTISKWIEMSFHLTHVNRVCPKWFLGLWYIRRKPCTYLAPRLTVDQNKLPLDPRHLEYHRVRPKWFPSLWYVQHKPCTYLAPILTLSPNGPKQAPLDIQYMGVPSGVPKVISMPVVHYGANRAPFLCWN